MIRKPDFIGAGTWRAWRCDLPPVGGRPRPDHDATLGLWLLHCPGAHTMWNYWWIGLVHLRPMPNCKPPTITTPGARWEIICFAQDPDHAPDPDQAESMKVLHPIDWVVQFADGRSDTDAVRTAEACVERIMHSDVSPDSDFRSFWEKTIPATARHIASGTHDPS